MLRKALLLGALLWLGVAGTALAGGVTTTASSCGDLVADAICMTGNLLFGPNGVVPFTTHQVNWVRTVVFDVVFVILPSGGLL